MDWILTTEGDRLLQYGIVGVGGGGGGQGITVYLVSAVLRSLCDDLVVFELCAGVIYLSFSIVLLHNDLFDLILYVHSTIFQLCGTGLPALNQY